MNVIVVLNNNIRILILETKEYGYDSRSFYYINSKGRKNLIPLENVLFVTEEEDLTIDSLQQMEPYITIKCSSKINYNDRDINGNIL